jgi:leucyl aminopeptidase (aminopeptidase T)
LKLLIQGAQQNAELARLERLTEGALRLGELGTSGFPPAG